MSAAWERVLAAALRSDDPMAVLRAASADAQHPPPLRRAFARATRSEAGVRMASLLVAKLRFERVMRGSAVASAWFERDGRSFTEAFRRYHAETPLTAIFPAAEAAAFLAYCERERLFRVPPTIA